VDRQENTTGLKDNHVFVISIEGKPLMPCSQTKSRKLLKSKQAKVIKRLPFTIQLTFECENQVQDITLGIDSGYKFIGFSAVSETKELISGELVLDNKTSLRLKEKAMYRKNRRSRHHWYRKPRFLNRVSTKKKDWLPPSITRRYQTHLNLISRIKKLLPISKVIIETGNFDIQKLKNPNISGVEYQQGDRYNYENTKSYILSREKCLCQLCGKTIIGTKINLHHIIQRANGGTDKPDNLVLLHKICHDKVHKKKLTFKKNKQFKESIFMNIIKNKFSKDIPNLETTYGYETYCKRLELNIPKSHNYDAFVIAKGTNHNRCKEFKVIQKHKNNRVLQIQRRGSKPSIRKQRYSVQSYDLIKIRNKIFTAIGVCNYGKYIQIKETKKYINNKNIIWKFNIGSLIW
jgi:hypothetical protein